MFVKQKRRPTTKPRHHRSFQGELLERRELLTISPDFSTVEQVDQYGTALFGANWQDQMGLTAADIKAAIDNDTWRALFDGNQNQFISDFRTLAQNAGQAVAQAWFNGKLAEANLPTLNVAHYDWFEQPAASPQNIAPEVSIAQPDPPSAVLARMPSGLVLAPASDGPSVSPLVKTGLEINAPATDNSTSGCSIHVYNATIDANSKDTVYVPVMVTAQKVSAFDIHFATSDGTAVGDQNTPGVGDYETTSGTIHFPDQAEGSQVMIPIRILNHNLSDVRTFTVTLSAPVSTAPSGSADASEGVPSIDAPGTVTLAMPPRVQGLAVSGTTPGVQSPLYQGQNLTLSASGVVDPNSSPNNAPISNVKFYLDNGDGVLNTFNDRFLGTATSGTNGIWSATTTSLGTSPASVGQHLFFAQATNSLGETSNVVALPEQILTTNPVLEPIDNDLIVAGRRYVWASKADLPVGVTPAPGSLTYSLVYLVGTTPTTLPAGFAFHSDTGTMIWDTDATQVNAPNPPYHFQMTATYNTSVSAVRNFYLTVVTGPQYLGVPPLTPVASLAPAPAASPGEIRPAAEATSTGAWFGGGDGGPGGFGGPGGGPGGGGGGGGGTGNFVGDPNDLMPGADHMDGDGDESFIPIDNCNCKKKTTPDGTPSYNSTTNPHPIIEVAVPIKSLPVSDNPNDPAVYVSIKATIFNHDGSSIGSGLSNTVYYSLAGVQANQWFHLSLPVDVPPTLETGRYQYNVHFAFLDSVGNIIQVNGYNATEDLANVGGLSIVNRIDSPEGNRWSLSQFDQLKVYSDSTVNDGVMLVTSGGTGEWFEAVANNPGQFISDEDTPAKLSFAGGVYHLTSPDQSYEEFDTSGNLKNQVDHLGNTTAYTYYTGADSNLLHTVTDPTERVTTYVYNADKKLSTITDFAGRVTTLGYTTVGTDILLSQITLPSPDGVAPGPTRSFQYDSTTKNLIAETNELGETTRYEYDDFNRLTRTIHPDGSSEIEQSPTSTDMAQRVIVSYSGGSPIYLGSSINVAAPLIAWNVDGLTNGSINDTYYPGPMGRSVDALGNVTHYTTGPQGTKTSETLPVTGNDITAPWELGITSVYERNPSTGSLVTEVAPSPTGSGTVETSNTYDDKLNLIGTQHPGFSEDWSYTNPNPPAPGDPNPLGSLNLLFSDSVIDFITSQMRTTTYTYYDGITPSTIPAGLLKSVTVADGTTDVATTNYTSYTNSLTPGIPAGLPLTVVDPNNNQTTYVYYNATDSQTDLGLGNLAEAGQVKSVTVAAGTSDAATTAYRYDQYGNVNQENDPDGRVTQYTYDALGHLTQKWQRGFTGTDNGPKWTYAYNALGLQTRSIDPNGNTTYYLYDLQDRRTGVVAPAVNPNDKMPGPEAITLYTPDGQVGATIDPLGHWTQNAYDARGQLTTLTQANPSTGLINSSSPTTQYAYNSAGLLTGVTDPNGDITHYQYDDSGNLLEKLGVHLVGSSEVSNNSRTDGMTASFTYDGFGEMTSSAIPTNLTSSGYLMTTYYLYDYQGRKKDVKLPNPTYPLSNLHYIYNYDAGGRLISETAPSPGFDSNFNPLPSAVTQYHYDHQNRLTAVFEPDPVTGQPDANSPISYSYASYPTYSSTTMTDPDGNATTWNYDGFGRLMSEVATGVGASTPFGTRSYLYDANGNLTQSTDRDGRVNVYKYDSQNHKIQEQWLDGNNAVIRTLAWTYDAAGNLISTSTTDGTNPSISAPASSDTITYDALNRPTSDVTTLAGLTNSVTLSNQYDKVGNRTQLSTTIGTQADFGNYYQYDHLDRLHALLQAGTGVAPKEVGFTYDDAGQLKTLNRFNATGGDPTNPANALAASVYGYDWAGNLSSLTHTLAGSPTISDSWTYDYVHRLTSANISTDGLTNYNYDYANQLTSAAGATTAGYAYDPNGNRLSTNGVASTPGPGNRLASDGTYSYTYDAEGNEILRYDASGDARVFSYDNRNRLVEVKDYTSATITGGQFVSGTLAQDVQYDYDTFDRRVSRTVLNTFGVSTEIDKFIQDGDHVVMDFVDPDGAVGSAPMALKHRYLYGPAVDQILAQEDPTLAMNNANRTLWFAADNQGSTRDLVNNLGALVSNGHFTYDAYGQVTGGDTTLTRYLYTARELDTATGLQYNLERWYDSFTGRWISQDPIGIYNWQNHTALGRDASNPALVYTAFADGPNPFIYVGNHPTNGTDPKGEAGYVFPPPPWWWPFSNDPSGFDPSDVICPLGMGVNFTKKMLSESRVIARGRGIEKVEELVRKFGGKASGWVKKSGIDQCGKEIHWYEYNGIGRVGVKQAGGPDPF